MEPKQKVRLKLYRHYKDKPYVYIGTAHHSETLEEHVLYEALYPNKIGSLWVRPQKIFFEDIKVGSENQPRFQQVEFCIEFFEQLEESHKENITYLLNKAFDSFDAKKLDAKLANKKQILLICAFEELKCVGFKLGYELNPTTFYSWLGAVDQKYQRIGLGKELMQAQQKWCREQGYKKIQTKTKNKWQAMLILNIKSGFAIIGSEEGNNGDLKILMEKKIVP